METIEKHYLYAFNGECSIVSAEYAEQYCNDVKPSFIGTHNECINYANSNQLAIIEDFL